MRREWMEDQKWELWRHNMQESYKEEMMHIACGLEELGFFFPVEPQWRELMPSYIYEKLMLQ